MRLLRLLGLVALVACETTEIVSPGAEPSAPTNLFYQLTPSGDPESPLGLLLTWEAPSNGQAFTYEVYGRGTGAFGLRATTTSPSFHDVGIPQSEYYVVAFDSQNREMGTSSSVVVDERYQLPAPAALSSITLNGAIQLRWADNVIVTDAEVFEYYRVYSAVLDVARGACSAEWYLEGTTSGEGFWVGNLANGQALCFAVSAVSFDGHESLWSNLHIDTPRADARNVRVYASATRPDSAALVFFEDGTGRTGVVTQSLRPDADVVVQRQPDGTLWLVPARTGVTLQVVGGTPLSDLTAIDRAPIAGYQANAIQALPGWGYVFRVVEGTGAYHFAAIRVAYMGSDYVVLDWSYQSAAGNADLSRIGRR